jgi:hypothetical protein
MKYVAVEPNVDSIFESFNDLYCLRSIKDVAWARVHKSEQHDAIPYTRSLLLSAFYTATMRYLRFVFGTPKVSKGNEKDFAM